ncbi:hypothetical protein F4678DRAFT_426981 [Xylaria arbuscula]|nr:hypothetical protein F4678DRAFT_426981 [Xylaria arbuscula]
MINNVCNLIRKPAPFFLFLFFIIFIIFRGAASTSSQNTLELSLNSYSFTVQVFLLRSSSEARRYSDLWGPRSHAACQSGTVCNSNQCSV